MTRYKIVIQYDGTNFSGFQSQKNLSGIQDKIESSIFVLNNNEKVKIYGASRTDAGVHALGQVAHFDLDSKLTDKELHRAINARLDKEIRISHLSKIEESFHSRFDAKSKEYNYLCCLSDNPLYLKDHYHVKNVDIKLLMEVSKIKTGITLRSPFVASDKPELSYNLKSLRNQKIFTSSIIVFRRFQLIFFLCI